MNSYKQAWKYVGKNKRYLFSMVIFLVIFQFFNSLSPIIIQDILDNQLLGVTGTWYQADEGYLVDGVTLNRESSNSQEYTIAYVEDNFYISEGVVPNGTRQIIGSDIVVNGERYEATKLSQDDMSTIFESQNIGIKRDLVLLVAVLTISIVASYLQRISGALLTVNSTRDIRLDVVKKFEYIDIGVIESEPVGKTANRLLADSMGVSMLYTSTVNIFISSVLAVIFSFVGMYLLSPVAATICLVMIPIMIIWVRIFTKKINVIAEKVNETNSRIVGRMNEIINGISVLKIFNSEQMTIDGFRELNDKYVGEKIEEVDLHLSQGWNGINLFQGLVIAVVVGIMAYTNLIGLTAIEAGLIYAFYSYITKIIAPLNLLFHEFSNLEHSKVKIGRIFKIIDSPEEDASLQPIEPYIGDVKFDNVTFSYNPEKTALNNVNIDIKAGQKIGLVGRSGSGKSTIINLLMRFNDFKSEDSGMIYIDGVPIDTHSKRTFRSHLGIILQEPILFQGTLASNIKFGTEASDEKVVETLKLIGAENILAKFDNDINSHISNNGANLSLGEKQLISLARVLIRDPRILIMDEATANIDTETESMINYALSVVAENRTVIIVAHRLSTIRDADQIIVLEDGTIVENGNHNQLLAQNGKYMEMYRNQTAV
ncbi:ABC transporter ATP-binding protein [Mollicutes bacterium LVI A0078]|nr:ABC transporter ATP-binding protein [Mollicutes bacterium LVI A0075]WOO90409.1 ABC transporter ATP-binding protein [Mollicutes bacterium LVI A0078]